jgi:hypothetical protein
VFASLVPGVYRVTVEAAGFKKTTHDNLRRSVGETRDLKLELAVGAVLAAAKNCRHNRHLPDSRLLTSRVF